MPELNNKPLVGRDADHPKPSEVRCKRNEINELIEQYGSDRVWEWIEYGREGERRANVAMQAPPAVSKLVTPPFAPIGTAVEREVMTTDATFLGTPAEIKIRQWWSDTARRDAEAVIPKAIEYSSLDLTAIGAALPGVIGLDATRTEAGIAFYALGKAARLTGAYGEGRSPSEDTWDDLVVYGMMGRFVRKHGYWGVPR